MNQPQRKTILKYRYKQPMAVRIFLVAIGLFACLMPIWDLRRLLWPLTPFSAIAGVFILGAGSVGVAIILFGLYGRNVLWTIRPGRIRIITRSLLGRPNIQTFGPTDGARLEVMEDASSDGPDTWRVALIAPDGKRHTLAPQTSADAANAEFRQINRLFRSPRAA